MGPDAADSERQWCAFVQASRASQSFETLVGLMVRPIGLLTALFVLVVLGPLPQKFVLSSTQLSLVMTSCCCLYLFPRHSLHQILADPRLFEDSNSSGANV